MIAHLGYVRLKKLYVLSYIQYKKLEMCGIGAAEGLILVVSHTYALFQGGLCLILR